LINRKKRV